MPHRKAGWECVLGLAWSVGLYHKDTVFTLAFHGQGQPWKPSTQECCRSLESHFPSKIFGRTRREPAFPRVHILCFTGWGCETNEVAPGVGKSQSLGAASTFSLLPYPPRTFPIPRCLVACCCSCFSKSLQLWMNEILKAWTRSYFWFREVVIKGH